METLRRQIMNVLRREEMSARDISRTVGIREREVYEHLPHISRTLSRGGETLAMTPPECLACGYAFTGRSRFTRPGRCPRCRATRVAAPTYRISCLHAKKAEPR